MQNINLIESFITLNKTLENMLIIFNDMTDEEKEKYIELFFGLRNKWEMIRFIEKYVPIKYQS